MLAFLTIPLSAFLYRHRGGFLPTGHTQIARLDFSVGMAALLFLIMGNWVLALASIPLWFIGCLAPNGAWMGIANFKQFLNGCLSGLLNVLLILPLLVFYGYYVLAVALLFAGCLKGLAYLIGKYIPGRINQFHQGPEMGEFIFGAMLGLALAI